jgi:hypothetical protein
MTIRMLMSSGYSDLFIPPNGTSYHGLASAMTGLIINSQSVPLNTPTTVTLPNNHQVKVTWNSVEQGGSIIVTVSIDSLS